MTTEIRFQRNTAAPFATIFFCFALSVSYARADDSSLVARLGVAVKTKHGVCLSIPAEGISAHTSVALVDGSVAPTTARAEVLGSGKGCPGASSNEMRGYRLRVTKGAMTLNAVYVAALGDVSFEREDERISGKLEKNGALRSFRSCASSDGLHLTVWDGKDVTSKRLWHSYYHLNQDLEADCTDEETAE